MNKTILITGTTTGVGAHIAYHYLEKGWNVIGVSRSESNFKGYKNYKHYVLDISKAKDVENTIKQIGTIDVLVNNAAVFKMQSFLETSTKEIDNMIDINLKGTMYVTKYALDKMTAGSRIFFINSVAGLEELENQSIYCASKHALTGFAGVLGKELQNKKIKVTSIHPGGINTPLWDGSDFHDDVTKLINPKQIAKLIQFICDGDENIEYKTIKMFPDIEWHN